MKTLQTDSDQIDIKELMKVIAQLKIPDLNEVKTQIDKILKKKKPPSISKKEKELINKIKNGGPSEEFWKKFDVFAYKLEQEMITEEENKEFSKLIQIMEKWNYERVLLMIDLAKLWDVKLQDIPKRLNLKPRERVYA